MMDAMSRSSVHAALRARDSLLSGWSNLVVEEKSEKEISETEPGPERRALEERHRYYHSSARGAKC
jgi:hypothetical protein